AALPRKAPPLVIGEPQPAAAQLLVEDLILFHEVVDDGLLATVDPSGEEQKQELQRRCRHRCQFYCRRDGRSELGAGPTSSAAASRRSCCRSPRSKSAHSS